MPKFSVRFTALTDCISEPIDVEAETPEAAIDAARAVTAEQPTSWGMVDDGVEPIADTEEVLDVADHDGEYVLEPPRVDSANLARAFATVRPAEWLEPGERETWIEAASSQVAAFTADWLGEDLRLADNPIILKDTTDGVPSVWVQAWVRVTGEQVDACTSCGAVPGSSAYGTVGDGHDGRCPSCADKAEKAAAGDLGEEAGRLDAAEEAFRANPSPTTCEAFHKALTDYAEDGMITMAEYEAGVASIEAAYAVMRAASVNPTFG